MTKEEAEIAQMEANTLKLKADAAFVAAQTEAQKIANDDAKIQTASRKRNEEFATKYIRKYGQAVPGDSRRFHIDTAEPMPLPKMVQNAPRPQPVHGPVPGGEYYGPPQDPE